MKSNIRRLLKGEGLLAIPVALVGANSALSIPSSILGILSITGIFFGVPMLFVQLVICWFAWLYVRAVWNGVKIPSSSKIAAYGFIATTAVVITLIVVLFSVSRGEGSDEGYIELGLFIWFGLVFVAALAAYFVLSILGIAGLKSIAKEDIKRLESKKPAFIVNAKVKVEQFNGRMHKVLHKERRFSLSLGAKIALVVVVALLLGAAAFALNSQLDNGYAPGMYRSGE